MKEIKEYNENVFESIKHVDEHGNEYWEARELQIALNYKELRKFKNVITKVQEACSNSKINIKDHFVDVAKMVNIGSKTSRSIENYILSRYACYLIVQNADSREKIIKLDKIVRVCIL